MRIAARLSAAALQRDLARLQGAAAAAALDAASDALAGELTRERERAGLDAPLVRARDARRRLVGADDPESLARELGSPSEAPAPWLAPVLPAARAPMRAAARTAVARALSRPRRRR